MEQAKRGGWVASRHRPVTIFREIIGLLHHDGRSRIGGDPSQSFLAEAAKEIQRLHRDIAGIHAVAKVVGGIYRG